MNLKIRNLAAISSANVDIAKINVVGGVNSSGKTTLSKLLYCYLKSNDRQSLCELMKSESVDNFDCENIKAEIKSDFSDIFYLDSISVMDLADDKIFKTDHIAHILECLRIPPKEGECEITHLIDDIISSECTRISSAGIKQIGIIKILIENGSLKDNSFLIIDEPESNLHPDWQIKFAEILVMLSKTMNITLYLNTYSPIFIEAVSLYAQYHDMTGDTNFYLTQKDSDGFTFKKINPKNMGDVYENLTAVYDELDLLRQRIIFKE